MTLEQATAVTGQVDPTPKEVQGKPTEEGKEPTVRIEETPEFKKSLAKSTSSLSQQVSLKDREAKAAQARLNSIEAEHKDLMSKYDELMEKQFDGDPESKKAYFDRKSIDNERRKLAAEKADVEEKLLSAEKKLWAAAMSSKADELVRETGIDRDELETCQTPEEMEVKALRHKLENPQSATPKFDSGASGGSGTGYYTRQQISEMRDTMTPAEWAKEEPKIFAALNAGRIR